MSTADSRPRQQARAGAPAVQLKGSNPALFLFAVAIALLIKYGVHEEQQISERIVDAQVTYSRPGENLISYQLVKEVKLNVRGPAADMSRLSPFNVEVLAKVPAGRPGAREVVLGPRDVRFNTAGDFEVLSIDPNRFSIQVEERKQTLLPVRVRFTDEPAAGARHKEPTVRPARVQVAGPISKVEAIDVLEVAVSLEGHATTFEELVPVTSPDPLVQVIQPTLVTVRVPMEEPELTIRIDELTEADPENGSGTVAGGSP